MQGFFGVFLIFSGVGRGGAGFEVGAGLFCTKANCGYCIERVGDGLRVEGQAIDLFEEVFWGDALVDEVFHLVEQGR